MRSRPFFRTTFSLLFLSALTLASAATAQQGAQKGAAAQGTDAVSAQERALKRVWWNQEKKLAKIKLSEQTRKQMDAVAQVYLAERETIAGKRSFNAFSDALEAGDWELATTEADLQTELSAKINRAKMQMMIDVMKLIPQDQVAKIRETFPLLLRRDWIPGRGMIPSPRARQNEE